ncbi:MAG: hypothetical protein ACRDHW_11235, partial [Ktedonobacteraceae bacterium]
VAPLALSHEGERLNVDGDRAVAAIAGALGAAELAIVTNVAGLLRDPHDPATLIRQIEAGQLEQYTSYAQGRMRKKMLGASEALKSGVRRVYIGNASLEELLNGAGTVIATVQEEIVHSNREPAIIAAGRKE